MTPRLLFGFTLRILVLWVVVRLAWLVVRLSLVPMLVQAGRQGASDLMSVEPTGALIIAGVVAFLLSLDMRAMRERTFLANLGVSHIGPAGYAFALAAGLEALVSAGLS